MEVLDLSDETTKTNTNRYLVSRLYTAVITVGETVYKLPSESLRELFIRLQRGDVFTQSKIQKLRGEKFINAEKNTRKNPRNFIL